MQMRILCDNTGQQQKYTLSETSHTLSILGRWFRIRHPFFSITSKFCSVARLAVFGSTFSISNFFSKFWNFFELFIFYLKRKQNCEWFAKKLTEIGQTVPEILYFKVKKSSKICDFFFIFLVNLNLSLEKLIITFKKL